MNPYMAMELLSLVYITIIFIAIVIRWGKAPKSTRLFALNIVFVFLGMICDIISIYYCDAFVKSQVVLTYLSMMLADATSPVFAYYAYNQANINGKVIHKWVPRVVLIANSIAMLICTIAFFCDKLLIAVNGEYVTSWSIYYLFITELCSTMFMCVILVLKRKIIKVRTFVALITLLTIPFIAACVEAFGPDIYISYTAMAVSVLLQYVIIQSRMISEAEMREKVENEISRIDVMTGLKNRRSYTEFTEKFTDILTAGAVFVDVNGLKRTNDEKGHVAGDKLIVKVAELMTANLENAEIFRISGDEFVALYIGEELGATFEKEISDVRSAFDKNGNIASIGACFEQKLNISKIISKAEKLMYQDKQNYYERNGIDRRKA